MNELKLREALEALDSEEPAVQRMAACRGILRAALAASKTEPQAQAGEPKTLEWMEQPRHIADAATIRLLTEAIAKKDAALDACVEALHKSKQNTLASAQGFYEDYGTTKQTLDDFQDKQLIAEIDAAIVQAKEARK